MLVPYLLIILSLLGIAVIVIRKIPVLIKFPSEPEEIIERAPLMERMAGAIKDKIARPNYLLILLGLVESGLRKLRIVFLKIDHFFVSLIARSREKSHEWTEKSREWMSERRMKQIGRLKLIADLNRTDEEKEENLLRTLKQNPKDVKAYRELGLLYLEKKNFQDAQAAFEEVLKINLEDEVAKEKLEEIKNIENGNKAEIDKNL